MPLDFLPPTLDDNLVKIDKGWVFVGDLFTVDSLELLGATEGDITMAKGEEFNELIFDEYHGPAPEEVTLKGEKPIISIPLIIGNPDLWEKISPTGTKGGGYSTHQPVQTTGLVIIPENELIDGLGYGPALAPAWLPAPANATVNALYVPRGYFTSPGPTFRQADGGKAIITVQFHALRKKSLAEGAQLYYQGDPSTVWPTFRM
jgi:hypothetical protein